MITLIYAHPYPKRSLAGKALLNAVHGLPGLHIRNLYELYPDFHINAKVEQAQLRKSHTLVLQHPLQWYHTPALLSLWFEKVLAYGWAYGHDETGKPAEVLKGKRLLWATTVGGDEAAYTEHGYNHFPISQIATPIQQTALFCGMQWLAPQIVYGARKLDESGLLQAAEAYRDRLVSEIQYLNEHPSANEHQAVHDDEDVNASPVANGFEPVKTPLVKAGVRDAR
jgi:glutathione-regulated potassium-efflux system ancillary protein KefF